MRNRFSKKLIAILTSLVIAFSLCVSVMPTTAYAVSQAELDALQAKRDQLSAQRKEKQAIVDELEAEQASIVEKKKAMDERNQIALEQMQVNAEEIGMYNEMIEDKARELEEAIRLEEEQLERYRTRVRAMEENGNLGLLAIILNTNNVGEFLTAMDDVGEIMESDRELEDQYIAARENTQAVKTEYEATKADLEAKQEVLKAEQAELEKQIEEAYAMLAEVEANLEARREEYLQLEQWEEEARIAFDEMAAELQRQREQAAAAAGNGGGGGGGGGSTIVGTGQFAWPTPSTSLVTSYYGYRMHPVYGYERLHTGIDIGAADGASVVAADDGTVTYASVMGGYGNCVMIDHGNGYTTLYAHLSNYIVYEGQTVSRGSTIGYVGSTGVSTGPHLHYEVRENGNCINPMDFY